MKIFDLTLPIDRFKFFFELHNLPSAFPSDEELKSASSFLGAIDQRIRTANYPSLTSVKKAKRDESKSKGAPPGDNASHSYNPTTVRKLSDAGYQVIQAPLYPVRYYFLFSSAASHSTVNDSESQLSVLLNGWQMQTLCSSSSTRMSMKYIDSSTFSSQRAITRYPFSIKSPSA